ncbi:DEAD/DEAH box helicase family protein [Thermocrinis minervae]|uniref:Type III restriction enzyme, res subunit n=1 Tax=Thermocrinis minervae TaxID=381751 RepID=A0A1M6RGV5_9AQUI|nr:DEAD/DEAH box helicase family protein [Thermocrinis minervae]SHK31685.1 Type III restriction enzyme, res subunit [Thermocrinis minervae]
MKIERIEKHLVLNKYLLSLFGVEEFKELQKRLKDVEEGVDSDGRSHFINVLKSFRERKISEDALLTYDQNIQNYVRKISHKRGPIKLKYFQYLAVLFTEIVLDNLRNRKAEFIQELNEFLKDYKKKRDIDLIDEFTERDLNKIAFWMATGSGKTLIAHINYHQFFNYNLFSPDNIIFLTPNEGLSKQHFEELQKSGVPCRLYEGNLNGSRLYRGNNEVLVIEITKIVEEKKGGGLTIPVSAFEGRNLVFVDEGHKGKRSEEQKWAKIRNKLAEDGFVFEYSATFGQILDEKNKDTLKEYAKAIIFDYSYKYFYLDGYGKDFYVLNVKDIKQNKKIMENFREIMFVANMLDFYEQLLVYEKNRNIAREYNIEKPLWVFVGATVTGKGENSDVVEIVKFIRKVIKQEDWLREKVEEILSGKLRDEGGDIFRDKFHYIRELGFEVDDLYMRIFGGKGDFQVYEIKRAQGEFGLRVGDNPYFGVVNIGDTSKFKDELKKEGISIKDDAISDSLFDDIKKPDSLINILIGSKKFIEGWDTWRVSSMGLINIGKGQGPQIIQLFGRGVRLKGKDMSLKRSGEEGPLKILETLNIYSIKGDYLDEFLEAISKEGVEFETIRIPIKLLHEEKWKDLYIPAPKEGKKFEEEEVLRLSLDDKIFINLDVSIKLQKVERRKLEEDEGPEEIKLRTGQRLPEKTIHLLNWQRIWKEIYDFKIMRGYWNLVFDIDTLKTILQSDNYKVNTLPESLEVKTLDDLIRVEEIAILILKKYIDQFYKRHARRFETENMSCNHLGREYVLSGFVSSPYSYEVKITKSKENGKKNEELIKRLKELAEDLNKLCQEDHILKVICFDRHLYLPILLKKDSKDKDYDIVISPSGLVESEGKFIIGLMEYIEKNKDRFTNLEIYLLRNQSRSGIGFQLEWSRFYPDFIMWVKKPEKQIIVFIEPHGLIHAKGLDDEKIKFAHQIKEIEQSIGKKDLVLESFILSTTPYNDLIKGVASPPKQSEYERKNVLFLDDEDWPKKLFDRLLL